MRIKSGLAALASASLALAISACERPAEERRAATMPASQYEPARVAPAAPPPAPVARQRPTAAALALTPEGLGPLRIGMTLAEVTAAMGPDSDPQAVGSADPAQCDEFRPARAAKGVLAMIEDGRLTRISLIAPGRVRTDRGVGLGSTAAAVRSAYGASVVSSPHKYWEAPAAYLTVWVRKAAAGDQTTPTDRGIVFEIDGKGIVNLVHAGGPSIRYVEGCL